MNTRLVAANWALFFLAAASGIAPAFSQQSLPQSQQAQRPRVAVRPDFGEAAGNAQAGLFMQVPVTHLAPGASPSRPTIKNPAQGDPQATSRGMQYFINFNCNGCHADNGGGGMGPSLSDDRFLYSSEPENIYLSIYQGRPNGMPAWGAVLPDAVIWDLVTYIGKLSNEPNRQWGRTFSQSPLSPDVEQLPSQQVTTSDPWSGTRKFSSGQKP
jgi:cytochrome c oxidase cbb3-type subunit III